LSSLFNGTNKCSKVKSAVNPHIMVRFELAASIRVRAMLRELAGATVAADAAMKDLWLHKKNR